MLSEEYLSEVIASKDFGLAMAEANRSRAVVSWAICDGALVIYDYDDPPEWFKFDRTEDGNSKEFEVASLTVGKGMI